ncbi:MAG: cob(I)yrinic acid a,c-diamide adenosyltransferase [Bacteroidetes bacterium]|nr:cob(I)yrinic acid a,c-diamide adenosyltransferase [Bacteroidota bacterium]
MKIYTKKGDEGKTSLIGGTRVSKDDARIEAYGTIDELNSHVGLLRDQDIDAHHRKVLIEIEDRLFTIGSSLASDPETSRMKIPDLKEADVTFLENEIDRMDATLPGMKSFILPGGHATVSQCHIVRCICRRSERLVVHLSVATNGHVNPLIIQYLNRLSDYFFVLSRKLSAELHATEIPWQPRFGDEK